MSLYLYDGATPWDSARLSAVKAHGGIAVSAYIVGTPGGMRCANKADVALARSLGLGVIPNWERASDFFSTCTVADAKQAGVEALTACRALGFPDDGTVGVPFSFDFQCAPSRYGEMIDKLHAAWQGLAGAYLPMGYGQSGLCDMWAINGLPGPHWLMASTWGMPYNPASPHVALVQSHDAAGRWLNSLVRGTDVNTITQPAKLPAWWPDGSPYGDDMALTAAESAQLADAAKFATAACARAQALQGQVTAATSVAADALARVSDLQAKVAALTAQLAAQPTVQPTDIPVTISGTGTAHIGGTP